MSFHICVELPHEHIPKPADPAETISWLAEWSRHTLYEAPLGIDAVIYQYWSLPASRIGLRLIGGLYEHGLHAAGDALAHLATEANRLEAYWNQQGLEPPAPMIAHYSAEELRVMLDASLGCLREAIEIAQTRGARLTIS